jgi:hypothetical protein
VDGTPKEMAKFKNVISTTGPSTLGWCGRSSTRILSKVSSSGAVFITASVSFFDLKLNQMLFGLVSDLKKSFVSDLKKSFGLCWVS